MNKYKIWSLEDIKSEIKKLENKSGFYLDRDVEIRINNRLRRTLGNCAYKFINQITKIDYIEFSKYLLDGSVCEEEVLDTIAHEFAHAYTDYNKPEDKIRYGNSHNQEWQNNAIKLGCNGKEFYEGEEFTYIRPYNKTFKIRCKECGQVYEICDMTIGSRIENYYTCQNKINNKICKGNFEIIEELATTEKSLKIIKKYIKDQLNSHDIGKDYVVSGYNFKSKNIKNIDWVKIRISYRNNLIKVQIDNKLGVNEEFQKDYNKLIEDIHKYFKNKSRFKFINNLSFKHIKDDKYEFTFPLDINTLKLSDI